MSIILQAMRTRAVKGAPWSATLHAERLGTQLPAWLSLRRAMALGGLAVLSIAASLLATRAARSVVVEPMATTSAMPRLEEADIPMLQSLPLTLQMRLPAPSRSVSAPAGGGGATAELAGGPSIRSGASALVSSASPVPTGRLPLASAPPNGVFIAPPGSLSTPLPQPAALLPPGAVPGQIPPPPGAGAVRATASPNPSAMPAPPPLPAKSPATFLTVGELPSALRVAIEGVRVQLHLYAPASRQRWLMVGGKRLREGDDLVDGVRLEEITPQGVVLTQGAQRFQVKTSSLQGAAA